MRIDPGVDAVQEEALPTISIRLMGLHEARERILRQFLSSYMTSKLYMTCGIGDVRGLPSNNPQYAFEAIEYKPRPSLDS